MHWEEVARCDGFKVVKAPATDNKPDMYTAQFHRRPSTPLRYTAEEAKRDGDAVVAQVRLRVQQEQQQASSRKACKRRLAASVSSSPAPYCMQAPLLVSASIGSQRSMLAVTPQPQLMAGAAGVDPVVSASAAAAQVAGALVQGTGGSLTGSLVQLKLCYHGGLPGRHLLLGRLIGSGGFAEVYEGSPVVVDSNGNIPAGEVAAAAATTAAAAGATRPHSIPRLAVKVYQSSKAGVASSTLKSFAARELRALQLLRGCDMAVQLMAVGELVHTDRPHLQAADSSLGGLASSRAATADTTDGPSHAGLSMPAAGSESASSSHEIRSCVVMELAQMTLRDVLQRLGCCNESFAQGVAMQLLKLLLVAHSGDLGYIIAHRDLKPANILVFDGGRIAVADFGVCYIDNSAAAATAAGAVWPLSMQTSIGTAYYAAPDLCRGPRPSAMHAALPASSSAAAADGSAGLDGGKGNSSSSQPDKRGYDASVDVFAVGVIVLEMLVGNLAGLFRHGELALSQLLLWEQQLQRVVDGEVPLPGGVLVSSAALEFIGCCCGVGRQREAAAAKGEPRRLTPSHLLLHSPWLQ